jgi:hypothetical protein
VGASGKITVSFGAFPGVSDVKVSVTGQTGLVAGTSLIEAWVLGESTSDHPSDEQSLMINACAIDPVSGVGFTILCTSIDTQLTWGNYSVAWVWN